MIDALQEQHIQANLNKQWTQRKHVDMICIKVNPPFLNTIERKKSENIKGLIIPKIKCYYNLQLDNNANIKTSFFPDVTQFCKVVKYINIFFFKLQEIRLNI